MAEFYSKKKKPLNFDFPSGSKTMEGNSNGSPVTVVPSGYKLSPSEAPVAPVKVQTKSISLNIKKGGPDARKSTLKACNDGAQSGSVQDNTGTSPPNVDKLFTFHIPSYMCGKFIGKRGWRIQMIRQQSGAKIRLQDLPFTPEIKTCVIIGSKNSIETAWCIIKKELPTIHLPGVDRTPAAIPVIMPENMQSVKMENNVEKNTSRYRVKTPYENFQITSGFNDRHNFDGRLCSNSQSSSRSLPRQPDLYQPGRPSDDGQIARGIGKSGFGQTVPYQGTSQDGQPRTLHGNYQQEQQSPISLSLPQPDIKKNLGPLMEHSASRPVPGGRLSTVLSVDARSVKCVSAPKEHSASNAVVPSGSTRKHGASSVFEKKRCRPFLGDQEEEDELVAEMSDAKSIIYDDPQPPCTYINPISYNANILIINPHIYESHVVRQVEKTTFHDILSAYFAVLLTKLSTKLRTPHGNLFRKEAGFKRSIGFDCNNEPLYYCRVVVDSNDATITAYPIKYSQMCNNP